jgi:hypothetical protein
LKAVREPSVPVENAMNVERGAGGVLVDGTRFSGRVNPKEANSNTDPHPSDRPLVPYAHQLAVLDTDTPCLRIFIGIVVNLERAAFFIAGSVADGGCAVGVENSHRASQPAVTIELQAQPERRLDFTRGIRSWLIVEYTSPHTRHV